MDQRREADTATGANTASRPCAFYVVAIAFVLFVVTYSGRTPEWSA